MPTIARSTLLLSLALAAGARLTAAQPVTATGQAESLFRDGKRLMSEGKIAEACLAFEGSYRKDPATSTLLNVADCREKNRQYATAWAAFMEGERRTRNSTDPSQQAIHQLCRDRAARLEPRLSFLIVNVPDDSRVPGLTVTRDGEPIDAAEWNRAVPADIGTHTIDAKAPAHEPWSATVTITRETEQRSVTVPKFKPAPVAQPTSSVIRLVEPSPFTPKRKLAIALAGTGVVSLGASTALYFLARSQYDDSRSIVDDDAQTSAWQSANQKLLFSQLALGLGAASLGTAAYLWFTGKPTVTAESSLRATPTVSPTSATLSLSGTF